MSGVGPPPGHHHRGHHRGRPLPLLALSVSCLDVTILTSSCLHRLSHFWLLGITSSVFGLVTGLWVSAMPPALFHAHAPAGKIKLVMKDKNIIDWNLMESCHFGNG